MCYLGSKIKYTHNVLYAAPLITFGPHLSPSTLPRSKTKNAQLWGVVCTVKIETFGKIRRPWFTILEEPFTWLGAVFMFQSAT